jgi:hypothetical protein
VGLLLLLQELLLLLLLPAAALCRMQQQLHAPSTAQTTRTFQAAPAVAVAAVLMLTQRSQDMNRRCSSYC